MDWINDELHRKLKSGAEYEGLIPKYQGVKHNFESATKLSDTYETLKYMASWVQKYHHQMSRVAPKLKKSTTQQTVNSIYEFLYWHFQYKLDGSLQQLYSPSAAWHYRKTGFDCKTFSLLASCILTELGIDHSFRKVQQAGIMPGLWSHVYVIVHDKGTDRVIDATKQPNSEVRYLKKYDLKMQNLKHIGLAAPSRARGLGNFPKPAFNGLGNSPKTPAGLGNTNNQTTTPSTSGTSSSFNNLIKNIDLSKIKSLFKGIDCIGGSSYTDTFLNKNIASFTALFNGFTNEINTAKNQNNYTALANTIAKYNATAALIFETYTKKKAEKSWNSCSGANFNATLKVAEFYVLTATALNGWMQTYFTVGNSVGNFTISNQGWEKNGEYWGMHLIPYVNVTKPIYTLSYKQAAPNFVLTEYLLEATTNKNFNLPQFLQTLGNVAGAVSGGGNTIPEYSGGGGSTNGGGFTPKSTSSGTTTFLAVAGVAAAAVFFIAPKFKDGKLVTGK
jgi:hypothetical protein